MNIALSLYINDDTFDYIFTHPTLKYRNTFAFMTVPVCYNNFRNENLKKHMKLRSRKRKNA